LESDLSSAARPVDLDPGTLWSGALSATLTSITLVTAAPTRSFAEGEDPLLFRRARTWWTLAAICLLADGNGFLTKQDNTYYNKSMTAEYSSDPVLRLITIAMWVICAWLMVGHMAPTLRTMRKQKPLLAVAVFAVVSALWSQVPMLTFRKAILLSLTFAFAWFFATYYSPADQRRILLATGAIMGIASLAWIILLPAYGIATSGEVAGEWKGVFGQKNMLGIAMAAFFSVLPFSPIPNLRRLLALALQAILPLLLIVRAHARESLIMTVLFVGVRVLGPAIAKSRREQLPFILYATVSSIVGVVLGWGAALSFLGKGAVASWSGRLTEWSGVVPYIVRHLWLGYGYAGFWTGEGDSLKVMKSLHVSLTGSDSGFTDNMLSFGLVGMSILLIVLLVSVRDFLRLLRSPAVPLIAFWYVGFILLTWVQAIVGNTFPVPSAPTFIFVVACCGLTNLRETFQPSAIR
jgi:exopolysaccharide production protein ExoQ